MASPTTSSVMLDIYKDGDKNAQNAFNSGRIELEEESDVVSPPLWETSPQTKTPSLHLRPYNNRHHRVVSSTRRSQEIAKDREKLMELIQNMPEDSYELSLKDIVEKPVAQVEQTTVIHEEEREKTVQSKIRTKKANSQKNNNLLRFGSMRGENVVLKLFSPTSLGIKKSSNLRPCAKVSPRPRSVEGEKGGDTRWWKKRVVVDGESKNNGSGKMVKSRTCNRSTGRSVIGILHGCWSFLYVKER